VCDRATAFKIKEKQKTKYKNAETQRLRGHRWWLFEVYGFALLLPQDTECSLRLRGVKVLCTFTPLRCPFYYTCFTAYPAYIARKVTLLYRQFIILLQAYGQQILKLHRVSLCFRDSVFCFAILFSFYVQF
jgi:hypothetical protein